MSICSQRCLNGKHCEETRPQIHRKTRRKIQTMMTCRLQFKYFYGDKQGIYFFRKYHVSSTPDMRFMLWCSNSIFFFIMYKYVLIKLHTKKFSEFVVSKVLKQLWWAFYSFIVYIYHIFSLSSFCLQPVHPSKIWKTSRSHMCGKPLITAHIIIVYPQFISFQGCSE